MSKKRYAKSCRLRADGLFDVEWWSGETELMSQEEAERNPITVISAEVYINKLQAENNHLQEKKIDQGKITAYHEMLNTFPVIDDETPFDVYKWCDDNILESAEKDGFPRDEITRNLDGIDQLTKSPRIMRLIRMAYWRGCRRGVDMVRQANIPVYPAENSKK